MACWIGLGDVGSDDILYYNQDPIVGPFTLGDGSGISHQWVVDINGGSDSDPRGLVGFQWSLDGETWSRVFRYDEDRLRGWIDLRNMSLGGGWKLGTRTVWKKVLNDVGGSATRTASIELVDMDTRAEKVRFAFPRPAVTGELFTIKVIYPDGVRPPADFHCKWSLEWGSLQGGYDETYREVSMERPVTGNECDEWTFTLPWSPFLKYHWRFGIEHLETQADWSDTPDSWPETTTFRATEGTRELGIPRSSVRLAWLLPDKDVAALGESITYRMSTSRPIGGGDAWEPEGAYFTANPLLDWNDGYRQDGGRSFTYTPHLPGLWVTGWYWTPPGGWRDGLTRMQFDPIVDGVKPRVSARTAERREGAGSTRTTPYRLTWTARDPLTIPSPPKRVVSGTGIARFQIAGRRNRGAWTVVKAVPGDTRATSVRLAKGGRVDLRIRARDRAGNWSTWSAWPSVRP